MKQRNDFSKQVNDFEKCPKCGQKGKSITPPVKDGKKLIVNFICPNKHEFTKITDLL